MKPAAKKPGFAALLRETLREAPTPWRALRWLAEYVALRTWCVVINWFPIELNLRTAALLGRAWWALRPKNRRQALENLRAALGARYGEARLRRIARRSFEHFAQVFLVELAMTPRLVNLWSWSRYVELCDLGPALRRLLEGRPTILVTAHFGNFELLGYAIARLGLPLHAVMRPLDNPLLNDFLLGSREVAGLHLLYKKGAASRFTDVLGAGGALAFIADQDAGRKGVFADFFGRKASWYKSIGLLAMRHDAAIVVGYAARTRPGFRYRIAIERIIEPAEWRDLPRPLEWITQAFAAGLENAIARWPEQYLWVHRRWKTRPKAELAGVTSPAVNGADATVGSPAADSPSLGA